MASYKVVFKPSVEKDLRSLSKSVVERIFKRIEALKDEPLPRQSIKLAGAEQLCRVRARACYALIVLSVVSARHEPKTLSE
jgi:mRNA interferase RelE/StbE